jgi:hypothetical protein
MKVLWLCNIMLPAFARHEGIEYTNREGWLSGSFDKIRARRKDGKCDIDLAVCFPVPEHDKWDKKEIDGIVFYSFHENLNTPEIYKLLVTSLATTDPMRKEVKAFYHRQRPFERYDDPMPSHEEDELRGEGSYPSGHSLRGWGISLLLAQIAPQRASAIFSRGWDYCNSRVIVGAHWQSDVDASRTAASIGFCALQNSPEFIAQMKKAQKEYKLKNTQTDDVSSEEIMARPSARVYNIDGTPADAETRGIVVEGNQKVVRK